MTIRLCLAGLLVLPSTAVSARPIELERVDIMGRSTEGGEAKLLLVNSPALGKCRIDAVYFGEMGRAEYVFRFGRNLKSATVTIHNYSAPIYAENGGETQSKEVLTLKTAKGRAAILPEYAFFRTQFSASRLAQCNR